MVRPEVKKKQRDSAIKAAQSRKAIKKLEKIVLHRKSKVDRNKLLDDLKSLQLKPGEIDQLHSTSSMQTKGLKKFVNDDSSTQKPIVQDIGEQRLDLSLLLKRKRRRRPANESSDRSSASEDTDDVSTDTEVYYEESDEDSKHQSDEQKRVENLSPSKENSRPPEVATTKSPEESPASASIVPPELIVAPSKDVEKKPRLPAIFVPVMRDPEIEKSRLALPISGEEQQIIETIRSHDIMIISGETGSGKTTQIPQFLYEAGYTLNNKMIGITEPRRVAAISMSERVAQELNLSSKEVSYQIRFSGNVSPNTQIKFMTDGVLLRECQKDLLLSNYSVIIIDEAHERSVFSDILIGLLSRIVPMRASSKYNNPLKLIIMSATLRVSDFVDNSYLFRKTPPIMNIEARQYPVTVQFAKNTPSNYLLAAYKKVCSLHNKMPKGGVLVFVTSQMDVKVLCRKLRQKFPNDKTKSCKQPLHCLGLYAMLPIEKQRLVFKEPPEGTRLCIIATNVAETSITIPNIKYVIDSGKEKLKVHETTTSVSRFITTWTSKSSAQQRMGRAGRIGPGYCFRLYSSAVFTNDFPEHAEPRILQKPVEDIMLQMKSMKIDNVVNFPFPTRPSLESLMAAEKKLILLGALDDSDFQRARFADISKTEFASKLTPLGKSMSNFAVSARMSKMIVTSPPELLLHVINLVSALTVREMFIDANKWRKLRKNWLGHGNCKLLGDFMIMIRAICVTDSSGCSNHVCLENGLRTKSMLEIYKLREQLVEEVNRNLKFKINSRKSLRRPNEEGARMLRRTLLSCYPDHVAIKIPDGEIAQKDPNDPNKIIKKRLKGAYECKEIDGPVYISSESALKGRHYDCLIYRELYKGDKRMYMRTVAAIDPAWLDESHRNRPNQVSDCTTFSESTPFSSNCHAGINGGAANFS